MGKGDSGWVEMEAAMPQEAPPNGGAPSGTSLDAFGRVAGMQAKLHRWAAADAGRRFDDLFNLVHDPATLTVAFARVAGNQGANTPGVDGITSDYWKSATGIRPGTTTNDKWRIAELAR